MSHISFAATIRGLDRDLSSIHLNEKIKDEINRAMKWVIESEDA